MQKEKVTWQCRYAPSLGPLEGTPSKVWGTSEFDEYSKNPTVFMGLYGFRDFMALWRYEGKKAILWCGSDINHFRKGYWLDETGDIRLDPKALALWISANCDSYVENETEASMLNLFGISASIVPSFMGDKNDYPVSYKRNDRPKVYVSVSGNDFKLYGWDIVERIAPFCNVDFHLYGNSVPWETRHKNVFVHGRVPKEQMNEEVKDMQCGLRTLQFDGFSEVLAKSVLWGQHPISRIKYPHITNYTNDFELIAHLNNLKGKKRPNLRARAYYKKHLNNYPWNRYA